jgi:ribulose-phosphate 3-epimerase
MIRHYGAEPILAYKSTTPPGEDFISLAKEVPWILKLTVNPGFSGQKNANYSS